MDAQQTGSALSRETVFMLAHHAAYSADQPSGYPFLATTIPNRGREVAYAVQAHLNDTILGTPERAQYDLYLNYLHRAIAWHTTFKWQGTTEQVSPFLLGLIASALIDDWMRSHDARCIPALRSLADWLWYQTWEPSNQAFRYQINPRAGGYRPKGGGGAPDLNQLIAPMYAFLWWRLGAVRFRDQGDQAFAGGVHGAWLGGAKQFNQSDIVSFNYVAWRRMRR